MTQSRFDPAILNADPLRRSRILPVLDAALAAVDPARAVRQVMQRSGDLLRVGSVAYDLATVRHVIVIAFGKAAAPMAEAVLDILDGLAVAGIVITKVGHGPSDPADLAPLTVVEAAHPVPDAAGVAATAQAATLAAQAGADDLVLCLVSGGGSSLLTGPAAGLTLADLQTTTRTLLACGATIDEINTLRKHLSAVKGGQLARLAAPAWLVSLLLSDVVGSPLDVIASGPTVPDRSTWADAWAIVQRYGLESTLPGAGLRRLRAGRAGQIAETPKPDDSIFERSQTLVIGDNALAAQAAQAEAARQGFNALVLSTFVEGEAREVARVAVALGREVAKRRRPVPAPACLILGGETTVTLRGAGRGGRNQELALAAGLALAQIPEGPRIVLASLATDGSDGPTDSAGGLADSSSVARGERLGLSATRHLAHNNAYPYCQAVGDLLVTGPTQTNVNDLILVFIF